MRIMSVSSDQGGTNVVLPVTRLARQQGHEVYVMAGGKGLGSYDQAAVQVNFRGTSEPIAKPKDFKAVALLKNVKPDIVLIGQGSPPKGMGLDWQIDVGRAANELNIPIATINDFWNGHSRLDDVRLDLVGALDDYDVELIGSVVPTVISGNPGVVDVEVPAALHQEVENIRRQHEAVWVFAGGGPEETTAELELLLQSLALTKLLRPALVPRFHPKYAGAVNPQTNEPWRSLWERMLAPLGAQVVTLATPSITGEHVAGACDATFSGFSTMLTTAAYARQGAVSLWTNVSRASLKRQSGLDQVPIVALGCAKQIEQPKDLTDAVSLTCQVNRDKLKPFNPTLVLSSLCEFVAA